MDRERTSRVLGMGLASLLLLSGCSNNTLDSSKQAEEDFSRRVETSLQPGNEVDILQGTFEIGPYLNRRRWTAVVEESFPPTSNIAYTGVKERVVNPLFLPYKEDQQKSLQNGVGWIVYYPTGQDKPVAVGVDDYTNLNILASGFTPGVRDKLGLFLRRVPVGTSSGTAIGEVILTEKPRSPYLR